jgi:hypothetical protein
MTALRARNQVIRLAADLHADDFAVLVLDNVGDGMPVGSARASHQAGGAPRGSVRAHYHRRLELESQLLFDHATAAVGAIAYPRG